MLVWRSLKVFPVFEDTVSNFHNTGTTIDIFNKGTESSINKNLSDLNIFQFQTYEFSFPI